MTLTQLIAHFLDSRSLYVAPRTLEWYHYCLDPLAADLEDRPLDQVTTADIEQFLARQAPGRSPRTLQSFYTAIVALCNWAVERGHLAVNPTQPIRPPDPDSHRRHIPETFSDDQIRQILAACQCRRDRAIVLTFLDTGIRRSELVNLDLEDLDLQAGFLLVHGKGDKHRYVPFGARVTSALQEYLLNHPGHDGPLFLNRGGKRLRAGGLRSMLLRIRSRARLQCRIHPHKFRHTFARIYLQRGDLESLRAILGHEDIRLTSTVYAGFLRGGLKQKHRRCSPVDTHQWEQATLTVT